jgi:hypothetical protein
LVEHGEALRRHARTTLLRPALRRLTAAAFAVLVADSGFTVALAITAHHRGGAR